jgi:hypothetical protein
MNVDAGFHHRFDDGIDLFFGGFSCMATIIACSLSRASLRQCGVAPAGCAWAFLSDANSFLCRARITSMMRS